MTENILPRKNSANTDNAVDLGAGSARFKDAYLSGNLYIGGTGTANAFDDYEAGTWTPVLDSGATGVTYSKQIAQYTKVGRLVQASMSLNINAFSATGDHIKFSVAVYWSEPRR